MEVQLIQQYRFILETIMHLNNEFKRPIQEVTPSPSLSRLPIVLNILEDHEQHHWHPSLELPWGAVRKDFTAAVSPEWCSEEIPPWDASSRLWNGWLICRETECRTSFGGSSLQRVCSIAVAGGLLEAAGGSAVSKTVFSSSSVGT